jgi:hypothetical protein
VAPVELLLIASLLVFLGAATQGLVGFGFGLIVMAVLPWLVGFQQAVLLTAVWCGCVNISLLFVLRKKVKMALVGPLIGGALCGVPIGVTIVAKAEGPLPRLILGVLLLGWALSGLLPKQELPRPPANGWGLLVGLVGGTTGAAFNIGAPPAAIWGLLRRWQSEEFRAALQAYFVVISTVQIGLFWMAGLIQPSQLQLNVMGLPAVAVGVWFGNMMAPRLDQELFRKLVRGFVGIAGLALIVESF